MEKNNIGSCYLLKSAKLCPLAVVSNVIVLIKCWGEYVTGNIRNVGS